MKVKLLYPFTFEGQEITECEVKRRVKVKDRAQAEAYSKSKYGDVVSDAVSIYLVSKVCTFNEKEIPPEFLEENLDYEDFARIWEAVVLFRPRNHDKAQNTQTNDTDTPKPRMELQGDKGFRD